MTSEFELTFPEMDKHPNIKEHLQEQLVFLYFNMTRKENIYGQLEKTLSDVLELIKTNLENNKEVAPFISLYLNLVFDTRSVISDENSSGKGENELTYMMIFTWYQHFPELAKRILLPCFTTYGSWRDAPYLCEYVRKKTNNRYHSLIDIVIGLANTQLDKDIESWMFSINAFSRNHISTVAKWIPREGKKLDWLYERFVFDWAKKHHFCILETAITDESYEKAIMKCKRLYRKKCSLLNKALDTPQIKQCSQNIINIDPKNISPLTEMKQSRILARVDSVSENIDGFSGCRIVLPISYFIKEAYRMISAGYENKQHVDRLNKKWEKYSETISRDGFMNILPIIDVSWDMQSGNGESFYSATGLAILVAERSSYGRRIMAYGSNATWINLEHCASFFSMVQTIYENIQSVQYTTSEVDKALSMIHMAVEEAKYETRVKLPKLVIFSNNFEGISKYDIPISQRLILWNVSTTGIVDLPCNIHQRNYILLSGISGGLLSNFRLLKKYSKNRAYRPYSFIYEILGRSVVL